MSSTLEQQKERWLADSRSRIRLVIRLLLLVMIVTLFLSLFLYIQNLKQKNAFTQKLIDAQVNVWDTYSMKPPLVPNLLVPYIGKYISYREKYVIELDASNTDITDDTLAEIALLNQIAYLNLENCRITNQTLERLQELPDLSRLNLKNTQITDAGLKYLAGLKQIEVINLEQTAVTKEAAMKLEKQLKAARLKSTSGKTPVKDPVVLF
ncbi:hypothetical protein [Gimesia maris]|uniref:hypothetical protein n=1 Tax=Gimesia maris TaxID=122 RepID=UPI00241C31AD|nr:hypothetical protein [Gimesia maris]|tara:strand:- start:1569 stop:2195 length:627 start_codon:yes stop_codon:yes gene_type:complete